MRNSIDGEGEWSFGNDYTRNVLIFGVYNSSSSHTDNLKNNFLVLGEEQTFGINGSQGAAENYLHVNITEICKFKAKDYMSWYNFCLGSVSKDFTKDRQSNFF